jgi:hypothetical protein
VELANGAKEKEPRNMSNKDVITGFAMWHPEKGFEQAYEGPIVYVNLDARLMYDVNETNKEEGTNNRNGWRATKVEVRRVTE